MESNTAATTNSINLREMDREELLQSFVEVELQSSDDFLKIRETLTRMGIMNSTRDVLYQSCHILHKQNRYYIVHFKELFALDGREVEMTHEDYARRNTIALSLERWGLCKILNPEVAYSPVLAGKGSLTTIRHSDKKSVRLQQKYRIGNSEFQEDE